MNSQQLLPFLLSQAWSLPHLLAFAIGIVLALVLWQRHPTVSLLALLGFLILLGNMVFGIALNYWLVTASGGSSIERARVLEMLGMARSLMTAVAYAMFIAAIFGWRRNDVQLY